MKTQRKEFEAELRKGVNLVCLHLQLYFCTFGEYCLGVPWIVWYCRNTKLIKRFLSFYFYVEVKDDTAFQPLLFPLLDLDCRKWDNFY